MSSPEAAAGLAQYLLGRLGPDEASALERRYLADDALYERLLQAEDDLADAYVEGALAAADRERFEDHCLPFPPFVDKVEISRRLQAMAAAVPPSRSAPRGDSSGWKLAAAVLVAMGIGLSAGLWVASRKSGGGGPEPHPPAAAPPASVLLIAGLARGDAQQPVLALPSGAPFAQIRLELDDDRARPGRVAVRTPEGEELLRLRLAEGDRVAPDEVAFRIDAQLLPPGDYIVSLEEEPGPDGPPVTLAEYPLRVVAADLRHPPQ